ncbi:MAG: hypothetical protein GC180_11800 [Bacteroidetes bacterium]|nr:hypothetical protein [Bacteroidota bacterium]
MQWIYRLWSFVLIHAVIFLSSSTLYLVQRQDQSSTSLSYLALFFLAAALIQAGIIRFRFRKRGWQSALTGGLAVVLIDILAACYILYRPEQSFFIFTLILAVWSCCISLMLFLLRRTSGVMRAAVLSAAILFLLLASYLTYGAWHSAWLDSTLLHILSLLFSVFLLYLSRVMWKKHKSGDAVAELHEENNDGGSSTEE